MTKGRSMVIITRVKLSTIVYVIVITLIALAYLYYKMDKSIVNPTPIKEAFKEKEPDKVFPKDITVATWLWHTPYDMTEDKMHYYIDKSASEGINTIYLDVSKYIDITEVHDKTIADANMSQLNSNISKFIKLSSEKNIKVEALAGDTTWANDGYTYLPFKFIEFVHTYNSQNADKFSGIHLDIETWNQKGFNADKAGGYLKYLTLVDKILKANADLNKKDNLNLKLSFDISYWMDNSNGNVPEVSWNGISDYPLFHLLTILNQEEGDTIVLMAYRNEADGKNGTIKISKEELDAINDSKYNINVIIGQETDQSDSTPNITFYGTSKNDLKTEAIKINKAFRNFPAYKGLAIHHLDSYIDL